MDVCMNAALFNDDGMLNPEKPKPHAEAVMVGLAAVGIGILLGIWVAGPALTGTGTVASDRSMRSWAMSYQDMIARPDPPPYRTATLAFDAGGRIDYAAAAKAGAKFEYGRVADDDTGRQTTGRAPRNPFADRHAIH